MKAVLAAFLFGLTLTPADAQEVKLVGSGAVACGQFNADFDRDPYQEREYFAWAQGLMSGVLLRNPPGVDDNLDLTRRTCASRRRWPSCGGSDRKPWPRLHRSSAGALPTPALARRKVEGRTAPLGF